ncbi:DUF4396 domain-containing protein [Candidatus Saccharibacteria bacterium]|nr:DUF4396 domain-containing protein [Candidatus Saccharibacteria bacterium]
MRMNYVLNKTAIQATLHCLTGCAVGEVLGMVIGNAMNWHGAVVVALSVSLAFIFGYSFSMVPLLRHGLALARALKVALLADTASIATMELADNAFMLAVPGAMDAGLKSILFWVSLSTSLLVAFVAAFPVNRWLISRGKGHAVAHQYHHGHDLDMHGMGHRATQHDTEHGHDQH